MTFPYLTVSSWFEENGDFPENLCEEDDFEGQREATARMEWEDQRYADWAAEHAEDIAEGEYLNWCRMREEDGEDGSREAYDQHIDALVAAHEPD